MTLPVVTQIDATHANIANIPVTATAVAGYDTGSPEIEWTAQDWARFPGAGKVHIDQSPTLAALASGRSAVGDIEAGAGTNTAFLAAARERYRQGRQTFAYVARGNAETLVADLGTLQSSVQLWLADWSLSEAEATALIGTSVGLCRIVAVQWASPTSNPDTMLPGGTGTLAAAQADLSVKLATWFPATVSTTVTHGVVVTSSLDTYTVSSPDQRTWSVT